MVLPMEGIEEEFREANETRTSNNTTHSTGRTVLAVGAAACIGLTALTTPFLLPGLRRYCLPYDPHCPQDRVGSDARSAASRRYTPSATSCWRTSARPSTARQRNFRKQRRVQCRYIAANEQQIEMLLAQCKKRNVRTLIGPRPLLRIAFFADDDVGGAYVPRCFVADLGSGDGCVCIAAAQAGIRSVGVEVRRTR